MKKPENTEPEFDRYAESYKVLHKKCVDFSGESLDYFAKYKIEDVHRIARQRNLGDGITILDYGAGTGSSVPWWRQYFGGASLVAADVSPESLAKLSENHPECKTLLLETGKIPAPDESFDIIFAACVFHHIDHAEHIAIMKEIVRVLRRGGIFIIFEHNTLNPLTLYAVNRCEFDINAKLLHFWQTRNRMRLAGLRKTSTRFRLFFPGHLSFLRPLEKFMTWLPLGGQYYVCGTKEK